MVWCFIPKKDLGSGVETLNWMLGTELGFGVKTLMGDQRGV